MRAASLKTYALSLAMVFSACSTNNHNTHTQTPARKEPAGYIPRKDVFTATGQWEYDSDKLRQSVQKILCDAGDKQYIAMVDGYHPYLEQHEFTSTPEFLEELSKTGVKHIFLESLESFQPHVDAYMRGELHAAHLKAGIENFATNMHVSPDKVVRANKANFNLIEQAKNFGIRVHLIDNKPESSMSLETRKLLDDFYTQIVGDVMKNLCVDSAYLETSNIYMRKAILHKNREEFFAKFTETLDKAQKDSLSYRLNGVFLNPNIMKERLDADKQIAEKIKILSGGERAFIRYGAGHFKRPSGSIDHVLGQDNMFTFSLFQNKKHERAVQNEFNRNNQNKFKAYYLDSMGGKTPWTPSAPIKTQTPPKAPAQPAPATDDLRS